MAGGSACVLHLRAHACTQVVPVAFSADSRLLAASLVSASVYVWAVDALPYVEDFAF